VQSAAAVIQAGLLPLAIYFAYRTVSEARAGRREEAARFHAEQDEDRKRRRAEADKARQADLEQRLARVVERVLELEELRLETLAGGLSYLTLPIARRRLDAAVIATGRELPKTRALIKEGGALHAEGEVNEAFSELSESLSILGVAARLPFEGE
jgi:hypothetical protein